MAWIVKRKENGDSLTHSGVKGMRWGERQYQMEDGSYTPEGKEHYRELRESKGTNRSTVPGYDPRPVGANPGQSALASRWSASRMTPGASGGSGNGSMLSQYDNSKKRIQEIGLKNAHADDQIEYECYDENGKVQRYSMSIMEFLKNPDMNNDDFAANIIRVTGKDGTSKYESEPKLKDRTFVREAVMAKSIKGIDDETRDKLMSVASSKKNTRRGQATGTTR